MTSEPQLFVALDVDTATEAETIAETLAGAGVGFKLGPRLLLRDGATLIRSIARFGTVFVDCKHFDIPSTMEAAVRTAFDAGARYTTVHALAGPEAMRRMASIEYEVNGRGGGPISRILVVTVLTSFSSASLPFGLKGRNIGELVTGFAKEAYEEGIRSFVCSAHEAKSLKKTLPASFLVTPGIRPAGSAAQDQARIETPAAAAKAGASALVVGRPILEAGNRFDAAIAILRDFNAARA